MSQVVDMRTRGDFRPEVTQPTRLPEGYNVFDQFLAFQAELNRAIADMYMLPIHIIVRGHRRPLRLVVDNS